VPAETQRLRAALLAAVAVAGAGGASGALLARLAPPPSAEVARGSEDAFASGLHPRELPPRQPPIRWTRERAVFRFRHLEAGARRLEVSVRDHRAPVAVVVGGAILGRIAVGERQAAIPLAPADSAALDVELHVEPFVAGDGRRLGTRLERVAVVSLDPPTPRPALPLLVALAALGPFAGAWISGLALASSLACGVLAAAGASALLWPSGIARSPYGVELAISAWVVALLAAGFAWLWRRRGAGYGAAAYVAALAALALHGLVLTAPTLVGSDTVFHANKLAAVARGDLLPTSVTQHDPPFRIPYGVSFYAALAPLQKAGFDAVTLVRWGAAVAGAAGSLAVFALATPLGATAAALATVLLQLVPATLDIHSYGNLSNVFGQAATAIFLAWWAGRARGGGLIGALLVAMAGLGHLSSLIVLGVLAPALAVGRYPGIRSDRARLVALALGGAVLVAYYAQFWTLVSEQLPRVLAGDEASGPGRPLPERVVEQLRAALGQWGAPAILLALLGRLRPQAPVLGRDLAAFWWAGAVLLLFAVVSPLEVRYLYALTIPLAVAAARGALRLSSLGRGGVALAVLLVLAQAWLALAGIADALLHRYRP
jgi:hypothetical protein